MSESTIGHLDSELGAVHSDIRSTFDLPERLRHKADPVLIARDESFFTTVESTLADSIAELRHRLDAARTAPVELGQQALERDMEVHRLEARIRTLRRFGLDLCLGHTIGSDDRQPVYIGRLGLLDSAGNQLLVDWRSPAAEPFFGATHGHPMGLARRRRYRWTNGRISDYWDEVFDASELDGDGELERAALDDQSAFIASLGASRSTTMRDVLGTIQSDQDAIIRAGSAGALVVDGGPGTGKTVVALHRAAYLLYSDPRLRHGVLFVGPHDPYLAYVADVLPRLGEESVHLCTLRDLVAEGASAREESDPEVARLKASADLVKAIEAGVRFYEEPPGQGMTVETEWADIWLSPSDWSEAFAAPEQGTPHNEAREQIRDVLVMILMDKYDGDAPAHLLRNSLVQNEELRLQLDDAWILIDAADLVADLWTVPAYLRKCAPWLTPAQIEKLQRPAPTQWTLSDLPLLDAARARLGDPEIARRDRRNKAAVEVERAQMARVVEDLIATDDSELLVMSMLRGDDLRNALDDDSVLAHPDPDLLAGPFAHIVVDEAQELTDAEWQMLLLRCPSRSFTIVGDRAQARLGFAETWEQRLTRLGLDRIEVASLTVNYRTPEEVMGAAEPVIREMLPDANVPVSVRSSGRAVVHGVRSDLDRILKDWLAEGVDGTACVIGDSTFEPTARIRSLTPESAKGLEFDLVVLVAPEKFGTGLAGAVDRYVAMTRATQRLVVLTDSVDFAHGTRSRRPR
ncbi:RNA polymerase recycling motor ATPase HelR [Rhodococcoides yunnanense]|uniref:RNA polymerase recycling motor ATPase HelR n=1 Tax=Rhodococcoides yunnanense TaxID=278209 RepID=UPI000A015B95|nr:RNA polymerase recycling motor ATPase HelR [Rhodococcus yunnanensis]